eukprot:gene486-721_t
MVRDGIVVSTLFCAMVLVEGFWDVDDQGEIAVEEEVAVAEDLVQEDESKAFYLEPHYFMRPSMYVQSSPSPARPVVPFRQDVFEPTYRIIKLEGGYQLPEDIRGARFQFNPDDDISKLEQKAAQGDPLFVVELSDEVQKMRGADGKPWRCHIPRDGGRGKGAESVSNATISKLIRLADAELTADVGEHCWHTTFPEGDGIRFCWNKSLEVIDTKNGLKGSRRVVGRMTNKTHEYQLAPDADYIDPLALHTRYANGVNCTTFRPTAAQDFKDWETHVCLHCPFHSPAHFERDRKANRAAVAWGFRKDAEACVVKLDIWSRGACTANVPMLHLNRRYAVCLEDEPAAKGTQRQPAQAAA